MNSPTILCLISPPTWEMFRRAQRFLWVRYSSLVFRILFSVFVFNWRM